jgi:hypothetical protein
VTDVSEITKHICQLAAEFAEELEKDAPDFGDFEMHFTWPMEPENPHGITFPVTIRYSAQWQAGEWKFTWRERLEEIS